MKIKIYSLLFIVGLILVPLLMGSSKEESRFQTIPDDAIRLRILANSDSQADQQLKYDVRDEVSAQISDWVENIDDIELARQMIANNISDVEATVEDVLTKQNIDQDIHVDYQSYITFSLKVYDHFVYPPGEYEAVLITLGEGEGSNWWCVLFPPLCFLDFSNGSTVVEDHNETEDDNQDKEVKVTFFLFELFGWS